MELPKIVDTMFPKTAKKLLNELATKKLTLAEFLTECAYWALKDGFDELRPLALPNKPSKILEYESFTIDKIHNLDRKYYEDYPEVLGYYHKLFWVINKNKTILEWLEEIKTYIPKEDSLSQKIIDNRIQDFKTYKLATKKRLEFYTELRACNQPKDREEKEVYATEETLTTQAT